MSQDGLLLSDFVKVTSKTVAADVGCGCGTIGLRLSARGAKKVFMLDISEKACLLARRSAEEGGFEAEVLCGDALLWKCGQKLDVVVCNPPYFKSGDKAQSPERERARHEITLSVKELCNFAKGALKEGGGLYLCCPPDRLADIMCSMKQFRIEPKELAFAVNRAGKRWLCLIKGVFGGGEGLKLLEDIQSDGNPREKEKEIQ